jgi:hypothetical protein
MHKALAVPISKSMPVHQRCNGLCSFAPAFFYTHSAIDTHALYLTKYEPHKRQCQDLIQSTCGS